MPSCNRGLCAGALGQGSALDPLGPGGPAPPPPRGATALVARSLRFPAAAQ
jgi:hypothetical protein